MSLKKAAEEVRRAGRGKDTELVHFTKREVNAMEGLAKAAGGGLTRNPKTGMVEAGFLDSLLPTLLGFGANMLLPGSGAVVGGLTGAMQNKENPLMGAVLGGMGGYGGGQFAQGLQGMGSSAVSPELLAQANSAADPINALAQAKDFASASSMQAPTGFDAVKAGVQNTMANPSGLMNQMGGTMPTAKAAGLAAAPLIYQSMLPGAGEEMPSDGEGRKYEYDAGYTGGTMTGPDVSSERQWYTPRYTPQFAQGGLARYAEGGAVRMSEGGFVIPADVVSMAGNGSSSAGLEKFSGLLGAVPIDGPGDGMSDDIPASIDGRAPARVARQEAYIPPETVARVGGARKLYDMVERVRHMAHGKTQQQRPVDLRKALQ
jgi:hypothetical protein